MIVNLAPKTLQNQNKISEFDHKAFVLEDPPHLTDFLPNLPMYTNPLQNSPAYSIVKQHFVDPEDVVSQKISTQKNSARGVHFRRAGPQEKELQDVLLSEDAFVLSKKEGSGLMYLFFEGKEEELSTLSKLCKDHILAKFIADSFMEYLTPICESLLKKAKDEVGIVFGKSQALLKNEDAERVLLHNVIELSTNYLPNLYFVREMCDDILKKGNLTRIMSGNLMDIEDEIFTDEERQTIDKVVMIISLLSDIDDFIEFYSRELARRLLKKKNGDPREIYAQEMITEQYGVQAIDKMRPMYDE
ncbi:hypothetical protein GIB67_006971 [Kingdonia uniflora]|uniref:Cullin family profile domain-containing protein n=1 Tax=Kingdonia uniflora TaxID=39325 RepID=A0A7J7NZW0_9MAGN|nr:hypothetical protein GIB67_006971 [Kingdonia uniflora]